GLLRRFAPRNDGRVLLKIQSQSKHARRPGSRPERRRESIYSAAWIHSAAPRHSVSRCSGRKKPKWPILATPASAGVTVMISGFVDVYPEHSSSTAGRVAQGSSERHSARIAP